MIRVGDSLRVSFRYILVGFGNYHSPCRLLYTGSGDHQRPRAGHGFRDGLRRTDSPATRDVVRVARRRGPHGTAVQTRRTRQIHTHQIRR